MLLIINSIAHFCVDGLCAATLFGKISNVSGNLVLLYNALAFSTQCLVGTWADKLKEQKRAEAGAILCLMLGWLLPVPALLRIVLIGIGNSLFHVTGGITTLRRSGGRSYSLGVFVAPGAMGLTLGTLYPHLGVMFFVGLLLCGIGVFRFESETDGMVPVLESDTKPDWFSVMLLTAAVAVRAIGGSAVVFPWKKGATMAILVTLFVVAGKIVGGFVFDRFGATKTAFLSILPAAILTAFYFAYEIPSFIGQFALNLTMPVTLWMLYQCLPDAPGLSFGLAASALFPGTLIGQLITLTDRSQWFFILLSFLFGIVAITISEKRLNKKKGEEI